MIISQFFKVIASDSLVCVRGENRLVVSLTPDTLDSDSLPRVQHIPIQILPDKQQNIKQVPFQILPNKQQNIKQIPIQIFQYKQ